MDAAHQSPTETGGDSWLPGDQHGKAMPIIRLNEETDSSSSPSTVVNSAAPDSSQHLDKPSSSPNVVEKVGDLHARPDANCHPRSEEKVSPLSTDDS